MDGTGIRNFKKVKIRKLTGAPATGVGGVPEMVIDGKTGILVEPGDELELARAIEVLIGNHDLRERFSSNAREFVKNFTLQAAVDKLEALYHALL